MGDDLILELFGQSITEAVADYSMACADCENGIVQAFEVYETACLIGSYEAITESAGTEHLESVYEGAAGDFLAKIVALLKKALEKIKEIGKKIGAKLKAMAKWLKEKVGKLTKGILRPVKWPNGIKIDFTAGTDGLEEFSTAIMNTTQPLGVALVNYARAAADGNDAKVEQWVRNHEDIIKMDISKPQTVYNKHLKTKFGEGDQCVANWIKDIFKFEQMGEDYAMSLGEVGSMVNSILNASFAFSIMDLQADVIRECESKLADAGRDIERISQQKSVSQKYVGHLQFLSQAMIRFSEFGVIVSNQTTQFGIAKFNKVVDDFCNMKLIKRKAA